MVLSCTGGYNGASLSAGGQYFSPARSSVTNLVVRISCYLFENKKPPCGSVIHRAALMSVRLRGRTSSFHQQHFRASYFIRIGKVKAKCVCLVQLLHHVWRSPFPKFSVRYHNREPPSTVISAKNICQE